MAQLLTVRLNKSDQQPLGFRLQGGKDFGTPLVVQKVNGGSAAERAGLQAGDALIRVNNTDVYTLRHQEAQDTIRAAGPMLELTVQRGGSTWRPSVTPTGSLPRPGSRPLGASPVPVTSTSLKATPQPSRAFGSGHNNVAKPFGYMNGSDSVKSIVNKQYNTPVNMYSDKTIAETLSAQTEVLAGGVLGVNFKKNEKTYDAEKSAVFKVLQEAENDPEPAEVPPMSTTPVSGVSGLRHVSAPVTRPDAPINNTGGLPPGQNICEECERLITGVFVRIKDKNLHVECFKCSTCGTSLKNQGYYNINGKLYCDIHAKLVARQNPPAPNLEPVTVPPGGRIPTNTYSTPLPPLATNNYTNGSSSLFSPSSNLSGPKPFGSSIGSAYSPSLSPRSGPVSPARPVNAPTSAPHMPFAPKAPVSFLNKAKNVKSIVWPPPNPPEDEPSTQENIPNTCKPASTTDVSSKVPTESLLLQASNAPSSQAVSEQLKSVGQVSATSTSQSTSEFSSNVSFSAASMSKAAATTSKVESIVESKQSQKVEQSSSCTVQSFSQKATSESQSVAVYQTNLTAQEAKKPNDQTISSIKSDIQQTIQESSNQIEQSAETKQSQVKKEETSSKNEEQQRSTQQKSENTNSNLLLAQKEETVSIQNEGLRDTNTINQGADKSEEINQTTASTEIKRDAIVMSNSNNASLSLVEALTTAPDRPYSPLPHPAPIMASTNLSPQSTENSSDLQSNPVKQEQSDENEKEIVVLPKLKFELPKRPVSPIPPIKTYNPPEKIDLIELPPETTPYIPSDFKINVEPKLISNTSHVDGSLLTDALTTAPDRPFTPVKSFTAERGSLKDALTIAPDRPFSPFVFGLNESQSSTVQNSDVSKTLSEIIRPLATQSSTQTCIDKHEKTYSHQQAEQSSTFQINSETSAFKPVSKQAFPSQPDKLSEQINFKSICNEQSSSSYQKSQQYSYRNCETMQSNFMEQSNFSTSGLSTHGFSSVKSAQNYFEQLDKKEKLTSTAIRSKSGLHRPDSIPPYQQNFELLPSQRGVTPEMFNAPAIPQRPVTPSTEPPGKPREKSVEPKFKETPTYDPTAQFSKIPQIKTEQNKTTLGYTPHPQYKHKDTPITMTFQPVTDDSTLRISPARSRPTTPSLINKPAPIIPHYQMNLVTVEHLAPETYTYNPSSDEGSRSPTPKPRSRSPAQGPSGLKAQAPRIKEANSNVFNQVQQQATTNKQSNLMNVNVANSMNFPTSQPTIVKEERLSNVGYQTERYNKKDMSIKEDSMYKQNYAQRQMESQNVSEYGNTTVQRTQKTFEEFERTQSAKVIEIRKGPQPSGSYQPIESNIQPSFINTKEVYPSQSISSTAFPKQNVCSNTTNKNVASSITQSDMYQTNPLNSGANQGPVCDPTPSTGSSVGVTPRGKNFGVSTAPRRGRGILNKAALPGSRVPLCGSCNGNIRANEQNNGSPQRTDFKSPAEERLIRKMAKMALNGYEIGIQRKIKPADHIQSMADKIQDTVVTKHPLNSDNATSAEISRENTLNRSFNKSFDKSNTYVGANPAAVPINMTINNVTLNQIQTTNNHSSHTPVPPPLPTTPVPTFQASSTPNSHSPYNHSLDILSHNAEVNTKISDNGSYNFNGSKGKSSSSEYSSDDSNKGKTETPPTNSLRKKKLFENSPFLNESLSRNILKSDSSTDKNSINNISKRKIFTSSDDSLESLPSKENGLSKDNKSNSFSNNNNLKKTQNNAEEKPTLPNNLYDNTLYSYKAVQSIGNNTSENTIDSSSKQDDDKDSPNGFINNSKDEEVVVRRRDKKNIRNNDGRRDSRIISRPLSTMTSGDVTDGHYPVCHKCDKAIQRGPFITALGRIWCPEHFICVNATCRRPLQDIGFVEENGQLYCEYCFEQYIAPACDKCHAKIKGDCLNAIGKHFHPECFICVYCGKVFGNNTFFLEDGLPYCEADWNELFTTKCFACGFPVEAGDRWVEALNNNYHSQCFNCTVCKKNLEGQSFFAKGGRPFCKAHAR